MITTTIEWHNPAEELPEKSGRLLVYTGYSFTDCNYSSVHKAFNASDDNTEDEARKYKITCEYWAYLPVMPETENESGEN